MYTAFLVLARFAGLVMLAPVFRVVPKHARLGVAVGLTAVVAPVVPTALLPESLSALIVSVGAEVGLGFVLGGAVALAMGALQFAMEIAGLQIGYGSAAIFDPMTATTANPLTTLVGLLAGAVVVGTDLHLAMLVAVGETFALAPAGVGLAPLAALPFLLELLGQVLLLAVSLGGPFILVALGIQVLLALVMRVSPSMNVFFSVGHGLMLLSGLGIVIILLPTLLDAGVGQVARTVAALPAMVQP
jgi:flagellar biosynthesis protein FliR